MERMVTIVGTIFISLIIVITVGYEMLDQDQPNQETTSTSNQMGNPNPKTIDQKTINLSWENVSLNEEKLPATDKPQNVISTKDFKYGKILLYTNNEDNVSGTIQLNNQYYDLGEVTINTPKSISISNDTLFGENVIRIQGVRGANDLSSNYYRIEDGRVIKLLTIDGNIQKFDLNGDSVNEIINLSGTAANTTVYRKSNKGLVKANLNKQLGAVSVIFDGRYFVAHYKVEEHIKQKTYQWKNNNLVEKKQTKSKRP